MNTPINSKENNNILTVGSKNLSIENWKVYHPNGKHMFTCGERKVNWYLDKGLAKKNGKFSIILTFIPKGGGYDDGEIFGKIDRQNICVVSGDKSNLQRHHIVPYCYRTHFPKEYKSKNHHDVVLINDDIHSEYEKIADSYKTTIASIYNVKTISELSTEYSLNLRNCVKETSIVLNALNSIFKSYKFLSKNKINNKLKIVSDNTNISIYFLNKLNYIQLFKLFLLIKNKHDKDLNEFRKKYKKKYDHGYQVVSKLDSEEKLSNFIKLWRKHFIKTTKPKYMPKGWSVNFRVRTEL